MAKIRKSAVAGSFYPGNAETLEKAVRSMLNKARKQPLNARAVIVPHAGFIYSGPVAASVYASISDMAGSIERIVMIGPAHREYVRGLAVSDAEFWITPLGQVRLDQQALRELLSYPFVSVSNAAHLQEHCLEVQLPFIQILFPDVSIVPILAGDADSSQVEKILRHFEEDEKTLLLISSDLSHFHKYDEAVRLDGNTAKCVTELNPEAMGPGAACGAIPVKGLLKLAKKTGWTVRTLDLRNSGDTSGDKNSVVGYGAFAFGNI